MRIEHIAVYTNDLDRLKKFYEKYFNAVSNQMYHNTVTGLKTYFLSFEDGARLEIMQRPGISVSDKLPYTEGYIHLAISLGTPDAVDKTTALLEADGYKVVGQPRTSGDGYYESVVCDPDGNLIELTV